MKANHANDHGYRVHLIRGKLPTRTWDHTIERAAVTRVRALQELHGCGVTVDLGLYVTSYYLDASDFYGR